MEYAWMALITLGAYELLEHYSGFLDRMDQAALRFYRNVNREWRR